MAFKLYTDKSSVLKKNSRYVQGGDSDVFPNSIGWWEKRSDILTDQADDIQMTLTMLYQGRPDLVSYQVYGRPDLAWLVLQYNNIVDINEEFVAGVVIQLPSKTRVLTDICTNTIGYQQI
jgi:hypothetical protein